MSTKIDWIEIKGTDFLNGLTELEISNLIQFSYKQIKYNYWKAEERADFNEYLANFKQYWEGFWSRIYQISNQNSKKENNDLISETPDKIMDLEIKYPELSNHFTIEREMIMHLIAPKEPESIKTFYISRFPISALQVAQFSENNHQASKFERRNHYDGFLDECGTCAEPVKFEFAEFFCESIGARLPTGIEWEYAARGPNRYLYPWGNKWDPFKGNFMRSELKTNRPAHLRDYYITPVDGFEEGVSPFGLWDMVGNLPEFTRYGGCKGPTPEQNHNPAWYWFLPSLSHSPSQLSWYEGFRPVKDHWDKQVWQGHAFTD